MFFLELLGMAREDYIISAYIMKREISQCINIFLISYLKLAFNLFKYIIQHMQTVNNILRNS